MAFVAGGSFPASIVPMPNQVAVQDNYIDFHDAAFSTDITKNKMLFNNVTLRLKMVPTNFSQTTSKVLNLT